MLRQLAAPRRQQQHQQHLRPPHCLPCQRSCCRGRRRLRRRLRRLLAAAAAADCRCRQLQLRQAPLSVLLQPTLQLQGSSFQQFRRRQRLQQPQAFHLLPQPLHPRPSRLGSPAKLTGASAPRQHGASARLLRHPLLPVRGLSWARPPQGQLVLPAKRMQMGRRARCASGSGQSIAMIAIATAIVAAIATAAAIAIAVAIASGGAPRQRRCLLRRLLHSL